MNDNNLRLHVYSSGLSSINPDTSGFDGASGLRFSTNYPGGLYGDCSFFVPRDVAQSWQVKGAQRLVVRNGLKIVWEGAIGNLKRTLNETDQGIEVVATGYWGAIMGARRWRKRWADTRITDDVWVWREASSGAEKGAVDRFERLRFTPKAVAWANNQAASIRFTMPTGETIKRITFDYDLKEAAQAWQIELFDPGGGGVLWSVNSSSTGSVNHTLATITNEIWFIFRAQAAQTPAADGTIYGQFSIVVVYSETGAINLTEILKDLVGKLSTELNSYVGLIGSNTYDLTPFIADNWESMGEIAQRAAGFGDSSQNQWAVYIDHSERATTPDGKPVLAAEAFPVLTDYDYAIRLDEANLLAPTSFSQDVIGLDANSVWNWIVVQYNDILKKQKYVTPDDDATLTDATSVATWGRRDYVLNLGSATVAEATNFGRRFLAAHKDPSWTITSPIKVQGYIRAKSGGRVASSEIRAGKRLKIENFLNDLSGSGLTMLIQRTEYDDEPETCAMTLGDPAASRLDVFLAQRARTATG